MAGAISARTADPRAEARPSRWRHAAAACTAALLFVAAVLLTGGADSAPASLLTYWTAPPVEPRWGPPVVSAPAWLSNAQYMRAAAGKRLALKASIPVAQTGWNPYGYAAAASQASWSPYGQQPSLFSPPGYAAVQPAPQPSWGMFAPPGMQPAPQASWSPYGPSVVQAAPMVVSSVSSSQGRAAAVAISAALGNAAIAARAQAPWLAPSAIQGPALPSAARPLFTAAPQRQSFFSSAPLFGTPAVAPAAVLPGLPAMSSIALPAPFGMHLVSGMPAQVAVAPPAVQASWSLPFGAAAVHAAAAPGVAVSSSRVAIPLALVPGQKPALD
ncbi:hypothetical protein T484DRAFT_1832681 [Baffinella frigidus]|nr:hypothetical protein T484DRAFT_1832681 [Cryptophyta sp. CCMP2293]